LEADYKGFIKIVETGFDYIKPKNSKEAELMTVVSNLLTRALQYKPKERPTMKDVIREMKKFEREKKYILNYSKAELEYSEELLKLSMNSDDVDSSFNKLVNENRDKKEVKAKSQIENKIADLSVNLSCGHEVAKDYLVEYALKLFIWRNPYEYNCFCKTCKKIKKLENLPLSCGCIWTKFGEKVKYNNYLIRTGYGKCDKDHPLTSIDLGLVNDFVSFKSTSLIITDYPQENLVDSFNESVRKESAKDIAWILEYTKAVTKLNLKDKDIEDEGAKAIGKALKINTTVTKLDLSGNETAIEGGKAIGKVLKTNTTLTELNLSWNYVKDESVKAISEGLKVNTTLKELNLSGNEIGVEGGKVIGKILKTNTTLTKLYLSKNNIGVEDGKVIGEALKTNNTLTKLNLDYNNIGDECMKTISELLKNNITLKELNLCGNEITDKGTRIICEALKVNTTLEKLDLSFNILGAEGCKLLGEVKEKYKYVEIFYTSMYKH